MSNEQLKAIIEKYLRGEATESEKDLINQWYYSFDPHQLNITVPANDDDEDEEALKTKMLLRLSSAAGREAGHAGKASVVKLFRNYGAVAAIAIAILTAGIYLLLPNQKVQLGTVTVDQASANVPAEILPGGNRAKLQLADGTTIVLDSVGTGSLATQGLSEVSKPVDGSLSYSAKAGGEHEVVYNTLSTPYGGQYHLELSDGTNVWLNAASSIRFPSSFKGKERRVAITGEAYFEVAQNRSMPFQVEFGAAEIEVLGTHFNINAYEDEVAFKATLIEGSINVLYQNQTQKLIPSDQVSIKANGIHLKKNADTEEAIAWKNGFFNFTSVDIETIMRQTARWYNIEVRFDKQKPADKFSGRISRSVNLSEFLKMLEYSDVRFKLEGRTLTVMP